MRKLEIIAVTLFLVVSGLFWLTVILNWIGGPLSFGNAIFKTVIDIALFFSRLRYGDPDSMLNL